MSIFLNNYKIIAPSIIKFSNEIDSSEWIKQIEKVSESCYPFELVERRPHLTMELPTFFKNTDCIDAIKLRSMFLEKALPAITSYMEINNLSNMFPKKVLLLFLN